MQKKVKIILYIIGIILVGVIITTIILYKNGYFSQMVLGSGSSGMTLEHRVGESLSDDVSTNGIKRWEKDGWQYCGMCSLVKKVEGTIISYNVDVTINSGKIKLVVFDLGETLPETTIYGTIGDYPLAFEQEITETGSYHIEVPLPAEGRVYGVTVFETTDSDYSGSMIDEVYKKRWQNWYDEYLSELPFIERKYNVDF